MDSPIVSRLAPTPSGYLHLGNAYNFLLNWLAARTAGGKVLLRIDDLDAVRVRDEYLDDIFKTLDRLGLDWDMGPSGVDDFKKQWSQTSRLSHYENTLKRLEEKQLLFGCTCSRKMLKGTPVYPRTCNRKHIPLHTADVAWRLTIDELATVNFDDLILGHVTVETGRQTGCTVLRRRDGIPAYQIASLTDDVLFGVNRVARGMDLLPSTALQLYLAKCLDETSFLQTAFLHHPLLIDKDGGKLSKSAGSTSLKQLWQKGLQTPWLLHDFAKWAGIGNLAELQTASDLLPFWPPDKTSF